jgi:hypothetical protein
MTLSTLAATHRVHQVGGDINQLTSCRGRSTSLAALEAAGRSLRYPVYQPAQECQAPRRIVARRTATIRPGPALWSPIW